jgi:hypothetical protein
MKAKTILVAVIGILALCGLSLADWAEPVPVTEVNSEYADWNPFLSFDGLSLYFARGRTSGYYYFRIFEATRQQPYGPFTSVSQVLSSSGQHVFTPWVSQDNLRMYYFAQKENPILWQLKVSERASVNDPWLAGSDISELNQLGRVYAPKLTADELNIFFCSPDIPGGLGGYDTWMATRPDMNSPFDEITNLAEINTAANEVCPSISPDGLTLIFQSNYSGDWQLFKTTRESLSGLFGNIEHLPVFDIPGYTAQHPSLSSDGSALYFTRLLGNDLSTGDIHVSYWTELRDIDIKPGSCPNPLNVKSRGLLPVAILGSEDVDVDSVDIASIRLAGVAPIRSSFEDVGTPLVDANECECSTEGPDGFLDLSLKFETQRIVEAIGEVSHDDELTLELTGVLSYGTHIEGSDCVIIRGKHKPLSKADFNGDGIVDMADFAAFAEDWLQSSIVEY